MPILSLGNLRLVLVEDGELKPNPRAELGVATFALERDSGVDVAPQVAVLKGEGTRSGLDRLCGSLQVESTPSRDLEKLL